MLSSCVGAHSHRHLAGQEEHEITDACGLVHRPITADNEAETRGTRASADVHPINLRESVHQPPLEALAVGRRTSQVRQLLGEIRKRDIRRLHLM